MSSGPKRSPAQIQSPRLGRARRSDRYDGPFRLSHATAPQEQRVAVGIAPYGWPSAQNRRQQGLTAEVSECTLTFWQPKGRLHEDILENVERGSPHGDHQCGPDGFRREGIRQERPPARWRRRRGSPRRCCSSTFRTRKPSTPPSRCPASRKRARNSPRAWNRWSHPRQRWCFWSVIWCPTFWQGRPTTRDISSSALFFAASWRRASSPGLAIQGGPCRWVKKVEAVHQGGKPGGRFARSTRFGESGRLDGPPVDYRAPAPLVAPRGGDRLRSVA